MYNLKTQVPILILLIYIGFSTLVASRELILAILNTLKALLKVVIMLLVYSFKALLKLVYLLADINT